MRGCSAVILLSALDIVAGCERSLAAQVTQVRIAPQEVRLLPSQNVQFVAFGLTGAGDTVKVGLFWSARSGNVSSSGLYTAPMGGEDEVCVRVSSVSNCAEVYVPWPGVDTVEAFTTKRVMSEEGAGASAWTASGGRITPSGFYTAPASPGEYQVCAQAPGFLRCERSVVTPAIARDTSKAIPVVSVTVTPPDAKGAVGQTFQLVATLKDSRGRYHPARAVTWVTSNPAVALVDDSGLVRSVAPGTVTITATSEGKSSTSRVTVTKAPTRSRMNAADSLRALLPQAAVAVAVPVEVREGSDVVVRLLIDPSRSARVLEDSLALERAAGMHVELGTTFYGSSMTALLTASGAKVDRKTPDPIGVTSRGTTSWTWVLQPTEPGRRRLWVTLTVVGAMPGELPAYSLARDYTIRPNWWTEVGTFLKEYWPQLGALLAALTILWRLLKKWSQKSRATRTRRADVGSL